jgi:beta-galactosidase GanA
LLALTASLACVAASPAPARMHQPSKAAAAAPVPQIVQKDGRWALMVDGSPFLMLATQVNNSSAWPSQLPKVWPAVEALHANTLEVPIAWEQIEPEQGKFDFAFLDLVENETGIYGSTRDHSPAAEALFGAPVPDEVLKATGKTAGGTWSKVYGKDADEFFYAWCVSRYVEQVAAAGKAEYGLPLYVNAALKDPFKDQPAGSFPSGGPTWDVLDIWKAEAKSIDVLAPDIYMHEFPAYVRTLELYGRPDNALFVPETANTRENPRMLFEVLGRGGIGFSPFGLDYTGYTNFPLGAPKIDAEAVEGFALGYKLVGPQMRELAKLSLEGKLHGAAEPIDKHEQTIPLGDWTATVSYGRAQFGADPAPGNTPPAGGVLIAETGPDSYMVMGYHARVGFRPTDATKRWFYARVEEGHYDNGRWVFDRIWNGDQIDWDLNLTSEPTVLRVRLGAY